MYDQGFYKLLDIRVIKRLVRVIAFKKLPAHE